MMREVKREAKVGELVKITNRICSDGYENGDICRVIALHKENHGVYLRTKRNGGCNCSRADRDIDQPRDFAFHNEYVVLEEVPDTPTITDGTLTLGDKSVTLTDEQMANLGINKPVKSPFARVKYGEQYGAAWLNGKVNQFRETYDNFSDMLYARANYCTDDALLKKMSARNALQNLLFRFAMENGGEAEAGTRSWVPLSIQGVWRADPWCVSHHVGSIRFSSETTCRRAIDEILIPYLKVHPEVGY